MPTQTPTVDLHALAERVREAIAKTGVVPRVDHRVLEEPNGPHGWLVAEAERWQVWYWLGGDNDGEVWIESNELGEDSVTVTAAALAALRVLMGEGMGDDE